MTALKVLIVDDEQPARNKMKRLLAELEDVELVGEADNGLSALQMAADLKPDLVYLDIQMPDLDGLSVARELSDLGNYQIVFVTAYDEHAIEAFDLNAVDYLLKPFDSDRLKKSLERVVANLASATTESVADKLDTIASATEAEKPIPENLLVKTGENYRMIKTADIQWIEAVGNYVKLHCEDSHYLIRQTLTKLTGRLNPATFARIHRSHIVNINQVKELQPLFKGDYVVLLRDDTELKLSRHYRDQFFQCIETVR